MSHADQYALEVVTEAVGEDDPTEAMIYAQSRAVRIGDSAAHYRQMAACHAESLNAALVGEATDRALDAILRDLKKCMSLALANRQHAKALTKLADQLNRENHEGRG